MYMHVSAKMIPVETSRNWGRGRKNSLNERDKIKIILWLAKNNINRLKKEYWWW
jgi:hypothetical protein